MFKGQLHVGTPEEVVAMLFRDPREEGDEPPVQPKPQNKRVMASLARVDEEGEHAAIDLVHEWTLNELAERNRKDQCWQRPMVLLYDGQGSLWDARRVIAWGRTVRCRAGIPDAG